MSFIKRYFAGGVCNITKDLKDQVVVITGANSGIGKETARVLARMGATLILACRDEAKTLSVIEEIKTETKNNNIEFIKLDLTDLQSVKAFADEFKKKYQKLNILINNAGIMAIPERKLTKDGFEMQLGTNHLGHFYLTTLLLDVIKSSAPSRVVNLASVASTYGAMYWDNLMFEKDYSPMTAYNQSKLANVLFAKELQKRVGDADVKVVSLHPGFVVTDLARYMTEKWYMKFGAKLIGGPVLRLFGKNALEGAQTSLYCALEDQEKLVGGAYYADCVVVKGETAEMSSEENARKLWEVSEKLIAEKMIQ